MIPSRMDSTLACSFFQFLLLVTFFSTLPTTLASEFSIKEATVQDLQLAFQRNKLTSRQLVEFYLDQINIQNPVLKGVLEVNSDALAQADKADRERREKTPSSLSRLHGIPILVKDNTATKDRLNTSAGSFALLGSVMPRDAGVVTKLRKAGAIILGKATLSEWSHYRSSKVPGGWNARGGQGKDNTATKDRLNTTAGSFALLGSVVPRDAGVVTKLREAGAIILGKATLSEWSHFRTFEAPNGWSARGGLGKNPYTLGEPCGSSSGSAISVAANLVTVSLGTETDGSILCPSGLNLVVGIKPTVGLTSRAGVVPISPRQDSVGPICRTVSDAAYVLETIAGIDTFDNATIEASKYIPKGGYAQFLKKNGLRGKRLGVVRHYYNFGNDTFMHETFKLHLNTLRQRGAVLVDNLKIDNIDEIISGQSEEIALKFEFKLSVNAYLKDLVASPVKSFADVIAFNKKHPKLEKMEYGQDVMVQAEKTNGIGKAEKQALLNMTRWSQNGFEKLMKRNKLDAVVTPFWSFSHILAIGGYPGVSVPAGYEKGVPFGICFGGLKGSEPKLIEIAYSFEQATLIRKSPPLGKLEVASFK